MQVGIFNVLVFYGYFDIANLIKPSTPFYSTTPRVVEDSSKVIDTHRTNIIIYPGTQDSSKPTCFYSLNTDLIPLDLKSHSYTLSIWITAPKISYKSKFVSFECLDDNYNSKNKIVSPIIIQTDEVISRTEIEELFFCVELKSSFGTLILVINQTLQYSSQFHIFWWI